MTDYSARDRVRATLRQLHLSPQHLLGQNFLCDDSVVRRIAAVHQPDPELPLLEVGPGLGALTSALAALGCPLTALELDDDLAAYLQAAFITNERVRIVHIDALDFDFGTFAEGRPYRLYANVPYNITTPLLKKLFTAGGNWQSLTLMLQKEAALRVVQGKGRANGPLTMLSEYVGKSRVLFDVPPASFWPEPKVMSSVIEIERRSEPPVEGSIERIMALVEAGFRERRKLLLNSLAAASGKSKDYWRQGLLSLGFSEQIRAEQLSLADFAALNRWDEEQSK